MTNEEKMLDILASMSLRLNAIETTAHETRSDIQSLDNRLAKLEFKLETDIEAKLVSLADGHTTITEQLTPRSRIDDMETEIRFLKTVMFKMNDELQQLKQAQ